MSGTETLGTLCFCVGVIGGAIVDDWGDDVIDDANGDVIDVFVVVTAGIVGIIGRLTPCFVRVWWRVKKFWS